MAFYSPTREDLYFPARRGNFFPAGLPDSEAALCAEMARLAYVRDDHSFAFDREQIGGVLRGIGFNECQFFESQTSPRGGDTHCFVTRRATADPAQAVVIVSFRGTDDDDPTDLWDDADFPLTAWPARGRVHRGFARALRDVQDDLVAALQIGAPRLLFTGHSQGAALATLLASLHAPHVLYTIGSPRVGDADFADALKTIHARRFVDCCDVIPSLPPAFLGFEHVGEASYIDRHRQLLSDASQELQEEDRLQARVEYLGTHAWRTGNVALRDLADHSPINYVTAIP
jgi:hypothetical protein